MLPFCADAHPWLCAQCQRTLRGPQKHSSGPRVYPESQLRLAGTSVLHLFMIVYRRGKMLKGWSFFLCCQKQGTEVVGVWGCGWGGCSGFPRPRCTPLWLQAGHHLLLSSCLLYPSHWIPAVSVPSPSSGSYADGSCIDPIAVQLPGDCCEYRWITHTSAFLSAIAWLST